MPGKGRPLKPLDPDAPAAAARFAAELRRRRLDRGLTQGELAAMVGCSSQHVSEVERARAAASMRLAQACDLALETDSALAALQPLVVLERSAQRERRAAARAEAAATLPCVLPYCDAGVDEEDVDPTNRRGILGTAAGAALGTAMVGPAPARAHEIDPRLVDHWTELLMLLGRHAEMFGSRGVLAVVAREIGLIAEHRAAARGDLRTALMHVEARWAGFAAWLCHHTGDVRGRDAWTGRALRLASESDYADMVAFVRARQSKFADDPRRAVDYAEDALRVRGASAQTRAWGARYAAVGHALAGDAASCGRCLAVAYGLLEDPDSPAPPWAHPFRVTFSATRATEARCWVAMAPAKAILLYEDALRAWPRAELQHGGIEQARLALACALAGETDRARAEGARAQAIYRQTKSATAARELRRLGLALKAA